MSHPAGMTLEQVLAVVDMEAQRLFHSGYEPRAIDQHDLAVLERLPTR